MRKKVLALFGGRSGLGGRSVTPSASVGWGIANPGESLRSPRESLRSPPATIFNTLRGYCSVDSGGVGPGATAFNWIGRENVPPGLMWGRGTVNLGLKSKASEYRHTATKNLK